MTQRTEQEERFLSDAEVERIRSQFKIPVDSSYPSTYWIIALDRESFMPTDIELLQLRSYCEFVVQRVYNKTAQRRILEEYSLPKCGGHNTVVFLNGMRTAQFSDQRNPGEWFYRRLTWQTGPAFVPYVFDSNYRPHTLVEVMDRIENILPQQWREWKNKHQDLFDSSD